MKSVSPVTADMIEEAVSDARCAAEEISAGMYAADSPAMRGMYLADMRDTVNDLIDSAPADVLALVAMTPEDRWTAGGRDRWAGQVPGKALQRLRELGGAAS